MRALFLAAFLLAPAGAARAAEAPGTTLEDFFTAAIEYSPSLGIAAERMNIGSARRRQADGQLLPQLSASANVSDNRRDSLGRLEEFDGKRYSLTLTQVLFNWQAFAARRQARHLENQLEAEYYYGLATLLTDVAERYLRVLQVRDALTSIGSELEAVASQRDQVRSLYDLQLARVTDLYQAEAGLAAVEAERLRLESELAIAREALRAATGLEVGTLHVLDAAVELPPAGRDVEHWVRTAERNNQQVLARSHALRAAEARVAERQGANMPQVSIIAQGQDTNLGFDNVQISRSESTYVGLGVTIPLYAGGASRAQVSEARSERRIAENELRQMRLDAGERVRSAFLQVQAGALLTEAAERLVESTALAAEAMRQGFDLGTVTTVDVLNSLRDRFRAERDLQQARYEHIRHLLLLKREAGALAAEDMLEIGRWLVPAPR